MRLPFLFLTSLAIGTLVLTAPDVRADDVSGLWSAKRSFGPFGPSRLMINRVTGGYVADMRGRSVAVTSQNGVLSFELPDGLGSFRGKFGEDGHIIGHWFRLGTPPNFGQYASPVMLRSSGQGRWTGTVSTLEDVFTFFLLLEPEGPDSWTAVLRNPERDLGGQLRVSRLTRDGNALHLLGMRTGKEAPVALGSFDAEREALTLVFGNRGGAYDFTRAGDQSDFYPRGKQPVPYVYREPPSLDDGWPTGTLEAANIDRPAMERFIQRILETPQDSADAPQFHGFLMARHGKLVMEEYFHGYHREKLHDTRSASKSVTAVLTGAVIKEGHDLELDSHVYETMQATHVTADVDSAKRRMTLEHLLTMSAGYYCDDTDENAPGNEEKMIEQAEEPDFYRYILNVPLASPPGETSVYCSGVSNLALGMVAASLGEFPLYAFDRLIAKPLRIGRYAWSLDPARNAFGGGSVQFLPRDFIKFAQLMIQKGKWNGRQILSREYGRKAISPLYHLRKITYGYLWWIEDLPYKGRTVRAFMALGAGGQLAMGIPELDLAIAFFAGNYSSRTQGKLREAIPRYVLPAVREPGEDKNAPVIEQQYQNPYGRSSDGSRVKPSN